MRREGNISFITDSQPGHGQASWYSAPSPGSPHSPHTSPSPGLSYTSTWSLPSWVPPGSFSPPSPSSSSSPPPSASSRPPWSRDTQPPWWARPQVKCLLKCAWHVATKEKVKKKLRRGLTPLTKGKIFLCISGRIGPFYTPTFYTVHPLTLTFLPITGSTPISTMCTPTSCCWRAGSALRFSMWTARPVITDQSWQDLPRNSSLFVQFFYCWEKWNKMW